MLKIKNPKWGKIKPRKWQAEAYKAIQKHYSKKKPEPAVISAPAAAGKSIVIAEVGANTPLAKDEIVLVTTSSIQLVEELDYRFKKRGIEPGLWYTYGKSLAKVVITTYQSIDQIAEQIKKEGLKIKLWISDEAHRTETDRIVDTVDSAKKLNPMNSMGFTATAFRTSMVETISLFKKCIYKLGIAEAVKQKIIVPWTIDNFRMRRMDLNKFEKINKACLKLIRKATGPGIVNAISILDAVSFSNYLNKNGVKADVIHSKMPRSDQKAIKKDLKEGRIKCLVYVSMISEGVNMPYLHWMCLRRPVKARVRFIQEVGRILRAYKGKKVAMFYDPMDLFGIHKMTYEEALGDTGKRPTLGDVRKNPRKFSADMMLDDAFGMYVAETSIRGIVMEADACKMGIGPIKMSKEEKLEDSTVKQQEEIVALYKKIGKLVPRAWKNTVKGIVRQRKKIRNGYAIEFLSILRALDKFGLWPQEGMEMYENLSLSDGKKYYRFIPKGKQAWLETDTNELTYA